MTRSALFLDRDGVINMDHHYVHTIDTFEFLPGVFDTVRMARNLGLAVIVVTNQAGIGRGHYSEQQFHELTAWMCNQFEAQGAPLDAIYYCPYHADGLGAYRVANHPDRKPNPGMLLRAAMEHDLELTTSTLIGDQPSDIEAATRAGILRAGWFAHSNTPESIASLADHQAAQSWLNSVYGSSETSN